MWVQTENGHQALNITMAHRLAIEDGTVVAEWLRLNQPRTKEIVYRSPRASEELRDADCVRWISSTTLEMNGGRLQRGSK